jgi:tRNA U34 5-methylaminomethyl-2-thiouridine-forming methyltransferase MnmC
MAKHQQTALTWREAAVPVSTRFDDPYFSLDNGLAETDHVFLAGNGLPQRFRPGFHIAELGFGTGLNMFATLKAWLDSGRNGPLRFTSFEAFPMTAEDMARALESFAALRPLATPFLNSWDRGDRRIETDNLIAEVVIGDARTTLPAWESQADAWFLDGFAPSKNPELWEAQLLAEVARHTTLGGTCATYTAAGAVRRNLEAAGFIVERLTGYGRKRHMTTGLLKALK